MGGTEGGWITFMVGWKVFYGRAFMEELLWILLWNSFYGLVIRISTVSMMPVWAMITAQKKMRRKMMNEVIVYIMPSRHGSCTRQVGFVQRRVRLHRPCERTRL